jgi:hypothetical protein
MSTDSISSAVTENNTSECTEWWCDKGDTLTILEAFVIILSIIGSTVNLITILAILFSSLRYSVNSILIGSQSIAIFLYCSLILTMQAVIFHRHDHTLVEEFCSAAAAIRYTLVGVIMLHLGLIALYRFLNVVYINRYRYMSKTRQVVISLSVCWIVPLFFTIPPSFKIWGAFHFQSSILACTFDSSPEPSNRIATVTAGFLVPCIFITFCYARIGCVAYRSFKKTGYRKGTSSHGKAVRLSLMMLCIFFIFFVGTLPYYIVNMMDRNYLYPIHHIWTTVLGWILYCVNPVVYTLMDANFRAAYVKFFTCDCEKNPTRRIGSRPSRATSV